MCAPDTHGSCLPGPYTQSYPLTGRTRVTVDVYLEHTGHYEPNEQSAFFSPLGDLLACGPIPPGVDQLYCGSVTGVISSTLPLTVQHIGGGTSTGSHRQRYEITLCPEPETHWFYLPLLYDSAPD